MFWIVDGSLTWFQRICINILKTGHVPKHVAFIMDGNRRYAKKANVEKLEGHSKGFEIFTKKIQLCKDLGIKEMTVYAFSIDNFKRSKDEVEGLMNLAKEKFGRLLEEKDKIMDDGICVRFIGNLSYLSPELRKLMGQIVIMTENNNNIFLNIAISYTSRDEITNSIKCVTEGASKGLITVNDIDAQLLSNCMYTNKGSDPDLVVRTSGEKRFSDFLLWQISCAQVCFMDVLWPELSIWHFFAAIFKYQINYHETLSVKKAKNHLENDCTQNKDNHRVESFLDELNKIRRNEIENYINV